MSYSALNAIDESKIARLGFKAESCNYIYETPNGDVKNGTFYKVEESNYDQIINILVGNEAHTISKGDKVFILPGHPLAAERIRTYLKRIGANITKNVNIATVVAGTEEFATSLRWNEQAKFLHMMMKWNDGYSITNVMPDQLEFTYAKINTDFDKSKPTYFSGPVGRYRPDPNIQLGGEELHFMTPLSIDVIYNVLSRKLKVVTANTIADDANSEMKLADEETYHNIYGMLQSNDKANRQMGLSLLFHCDLRGETRYNVWRLTQFSNTVRYADKSKSKDHFLQRTSWNEVANMAKEEFLLDAYTNKYITKKILDDLIPVLQDQHVDDILNSKDDDFYEHEKLENGDIIIRLKDKWKEVESIKTEEDESVKL
jgi:hypothetical protein